MPTPRDIYAWLEQLKGSALNADEGAMFGDPSREITGVTVCWMPSPENIRRCADNKHELLIHHEAMLYPYPFEHQQPLNALHWYTNTQRLESLGCANITATRLHGTIDQLWIFQAFAEQLGLSRVAAAGREYHHRVFEIDPIPYEELIARVKQATGLPTLRATSINPDRLVRKIGMPWGGMGLFVNVSYMQDLLELARDIDVMIAGETDNYGFRFCTELGIDVIETSHEISENIGLERFAAALKKQFPQIDVRFIEEQCIWRAR